MEQERARRYRITKADVMKSHAVALDEIADGRALPFTHEREHTRSLEQEECPQG